MARKKRESRNEPEQMRPFTEQELAFMGWLAPAFPAWYRANYDEDGRYVGEMLPGLTPLKQQDERGTQ